MSPQSIMGLAAGFMSSRAVLTAVELDLFTALGAGERSAPDLARALGTDPRATDRLLNVLCTLGLLHKTAAGFRNAEAALRFLVRGAPEFMDGLMHWVHLWESWSTLTAAVRRGGTVIDRAVNERGDAWLRAFIAAMHWRARQHAPAIVAALDLSGVSRVLDVGGGSGAYALEFARAKPSLRAVVFDLPNVLPLTAGYLGGCEGGERVELVPGDYDRDELGTGFDLVLLSAIIHSNSPRDNRDLVRRCAAALNPGGRLVVQDFIVDEGRAGPPFALLFALNMLVGTPQGDTYTESEVRQWMAEAGLSAVTRHEMRFGTSVLIGRKPGGSPEAGAHRQ